MQKLFILSFLLFAGISQLNAQVKIGSAGIANTDAVLDLDGGTNKGLLLPRLTGPQITALTTAPDGLFIYNTTDGFVYLRKAGIWQKISDATTGGGGLVLPYYGTAPATAGNSAFKVQNTTAGIGISGEALGGGYGVAGFSSSGAGGFFSSNSGPALVTGMGNVGIGTSILYPPIFPLDVTGRIHIRNKLNQTPGIWFEKIATPLDQSSFFGVVNDSILGIYGTQAGQWKFFFNHNNNNFGIYNSNPRAPLSFQAVAGNKIDLYYESPTAMYGVGLAASELQLYTTNNTAHTSIGYGSSTNFTETFRVNNTGSTVITNPQVLLPATQIATYFKAGNSYAGAIKTIGAFPIGSGARLGLFTGASTDINSLAERMSISNAGNIGIGIVAPSNPLSFPATLEKKISLYPGATGDVGLAVSGNELRLYGDNLNAATTIGYDNFTNGFKEIFRVDPTGSTTLTNPVTLAANVQAAAYFKAANGYSGAIKTIGTGGFASRMGLFTYASVNAGDLKEWVSITDAGNTGINTTTPNSRLQVEGSVSMPIKTITGNYTITDNDYTIHYTGTVQESTVTLPAAAGRKGRMYIISAAFPRTSNSFFFPNHLLIYNESGNNVFGDNPSYLDPNGTSWDALLNYGSDSFTILKRKLSVTLQSDGAKWIIVANNFQY